MNIMKSATIITFLILVLLTACAPQRMTFMDSPYVPAADAKATVSRDRNDNAVIEVEVRYMADPLKLQPPQAIYIVWAQTPQGKSFNLGQLQVGGDRKGKLRTTTTLDEFRLIITAEPQTAASSLTPGPQIITTTDYIRVE